MEKLKLMKFVGFHKKIKEISNPNLEKDYIDLKNTEQIDPRKIVP